ncbi:unnamed protein product [Lactuca saligna]|uniref:Dynein light chain n=1 Tax=Lactuca saligna TaxID=75948 RepID=A0AA36EH78_LACSI|nr:unnamed protein product [Lactuca saligna]
MATHKKGIMYVYKLDTGNHQPEPHYLATTPPPTTITKKSISRTLGSLLWRSKTYREKTHHHNPDKEDTKEMVQESSRKSVPAIDSGIGEGRKPAWGTEVGMVAGRRSAENRAEMVMVNVGELAELFQVKVFVTDMPAFMQVHAFRCARKTLDSLEKFAPKQIAFNMKKDFDKVYGPAWHCIVGSSFGSFVTHATGLLIAY